jgi:plastocyanin
MRYFQGTIS